MIQEFEELSRLSYNMIVEKDNITRLYVHIHDIINSIKKLLVIFLYKKHLYERTFLQKTELSLIKILIYKKCFN